jgi:hypothetical protein
MRAPGGVEANRPGVTRNFGANPLRPALPALYSGEKG